MRRIFHRQRTLFHVMPRNPIGRELAAVSDILDANPHVLAMVHRDLVGTARADHGREGMTAEQVLRAAVVKQSQNLTYEELAFHLGDSQAFRAFVRPFRELSGWTGPCRAHRGERGWRSGTASCCGSHRPPSTGSRSSS